MSLRRVDARFLLPHVPAHAAVLDSAQEWREWLPSAGVRVDARDGAPDLAVAGAAQAAEAAASRAGMVIVEGRRASRALRAAFPVVERFLPIPSVREPQLILPLQHRAAGDYAVRHWSLGGTVRRRARNQLARLLLAHGALPELRSVVTVGTRSAGPPFFVRAAESLGVPDRSEWFLTLGSADALARGVFHLFPPGAPEPSWAPRSSRAFRATPSHSIGTSAGSILPRGGGGRAAPRPAAARPARSRRPFRRRRDSRRRRASDTSSAGRCAELGEDRGDRGRRGVDDRGRSDDRRGTGAAGIRAAAPRGGRPSALADFDVPADLVERVAAVPAVVQHNDLGSWNIVSGGPAGFTAVDGKSACAEGMPLWDLAYFYGRPGPPRQGKPA